MSTEKLLRGLDGIPFRLLPDQSVPHRKEDDPGFMQPRAMADAYVRVFDTEEKKDMKEYEKVWDEAAKGRVMISKEEMQWSEKTGSWKIFLRWGEVFLEMPKSEVAEHEQHHYV
jgi:hypothetical protein